eukprot:451320-Pyramimonas_sp.AAC.1
MPAANKWWTFGSTQEYQGLGMLCYRILPRVLERAAIGNHGQAHLDELARDNPNMWYKAYAGSKEKKSMEFMRNFPVGDHAVATSLVLCEPLDHLSNRMQYLDETGKFSLDELVKDNGILAGCMSHLWYLLHPVDPGASPPVRSVWPTEALWFHFGGLGSFESFVENYYGTGMQLLSQLESRFAVPNMNYPKRFFKDYLQYGTLGAFDRLRHENRCCLDSMFSLGEGRPSGASRFSAYLVSLP